VILDHSGAVFRHGLPEDHVEWTLDTDRRAATPAHEKRKEGRSRSSSSTPFSPNRPVFRAFGCGIHPQAPHGGLTMIA
jgi:hypothetical protein